MPTGYADWGGLSEGITLHNEIACGHIYIYIYINIYIYIYIKKQCMVDSILRSMLGAVGS